MWPNRDGRSNLETSSFPIPLGSKGWGPTCRVACVGPNTHGGPKWEGKGREPTPRVGVPMPTTHNIILYLIDLIYALDPNGFSYMC